MTVGEFAKALAALLVQAKEAGLEEAELIALLRQQADAMQQRIGRVVPPRGPKP